jgi:F420-non-reducing hydrogenase iron-sulfur subunit
MNIANDSKLKLYIFYCSNCFDGDEFNRLMSEDEGAEQKMISLPCSGKADLLYLLKAFETGADGLALVTCSKNECHYLEGNLRAPKRAEEANAILEETGMDGNRITVLQMNENGIREIVSKMTEFREKIRGLSSRAAGSADAGTSMNESLPVCG